MKGKVWTWIAVLAFAVVVWMALRLIGPAVPNEIRLLTGLEGTTFHEDGLLYKEILERRGVTVHLVQTSGSVENLEGVIEADEPTAGFVWGLWDRDGRKQDPPEGVESLGTLYRLPLWVFGRKDLGITQLRDLSGFRVEAGKKGSDSRLLATFLIEEEGVEEEVDLDPTTALTIEQVQESLKDDRLGAVIAVGTPDSELIDTLLRSPELQVLSVERAEAFSMQYPFLQPVRFPEGGHDLSANIPNQDLELLAATAQLIVSDLFPPALADLLLQAAKEIHSPATPFSAQGEFPRPDSAPLPLSRAADSFYTDGPPKLQKFLPFRLATWINRFMTALIAIASAAITIFKILPALITLPFRLRMRRGYIDLQALERSAAAGTEKKTLLDELAQLDRSTAAIRVPIHKFDAEWIELRQFMHDMRDRLEEM
jgi:TRAP-type uncharacterized transport system substrate-binding protein